MNKYKLVPMHNTHIESLDDSYSMSWACLIQNSEAIDDINNMLNREDITSAYFEAETGNDENIYISFQYPSFASNNRYFKVVFI